MLRDGKGTSFGKHVGDYCVVDLETTGVYISSSRIIEISAIKVRDNIVVDEFSTLVNPNCHIPKEATDVNHITDDMVKDSPIIYSVIDPFLSFIGNDVIVGYNNAGFDMNMIYDVVKAKNGDTFSNNYIDVMHAARRCISGVENYRLSTVCDYYNLDTVGEHRALKDCYLTKDCYDNLYNEFGDTAFHPRSRSRYYEKSVSVETQALRELQAILEAIIADGQVTMEEFSFLSLWMSDHFELRGNYPFDRVFNALDKVLEDGIVTDDELKELQVLFSEYVDPVKSNCVHDTIDTLEGCHICVTGDFDYGNRNVVFALIEQTGGIIDKTVKKATNYVVVGAKGSENWKTGNYGGKIQKAMEYIKKGIDIKIMEEAEFIPMIQSLKHK